MKNEIPIGETTKISVLLEAYPKALDALTVASPAFQKLKNPALRKLFASRVTIEQAAKIGRVSSEALLASIREACSTDVMEVGAASHKEAQPEGRDARPALLIATKEKDFITLDVRQDLENNIDPFRKIMKAVKHLGSGQILHLVNSFEPAPLYNVLGGRGFDHWAEQISDEWHIYFFKRPVGLTDSSTTLEPAISGIAKSIAHDATVIELDVAGLEPPEPMQRILIALSTLGEGSSLLIHHHREPLLLYDQLTQRGFHWKTEKIAEGQYKILIAREEA
ncbi:MAG TPA: DUF2249 domain-containing protein [Candidatus Kapabacteria bacterium]|nr:DUF2249 domain-containing protein [Candidatus Kapabacteria bacterium]